MSSAVGIALLLGGLLLRWWGVAYLKDAGVRNLAGTRTPAGWAIDGPYAWMDHPLYIGSGMMIAGVGMAALGWGGVALVMPAIPYFVERAMLETEMHSYNVMAKKFEESQSNEI